MFTNFILSKFINNFNDVENENVRKSYGYVGGIVGVVVNSILFSVELFIGIILNSIAVTADAFHNLTDVASCIITIVSFKLSIKPADKEHPFGHGRLEYVGSLLVSFLIVLVGFEFIKSSFSRILNPSAQKFEIISFCLIVVAIPLKLWYSSFNKTLGKRIDSITLKAAGADAFNDVYILSGVIISLLIYKFTNLTVDGYVGLIIAGLIIYSGISLIKDTLDPLLGKTPDPHLAEIIIDDVMKYDCINGVHDLIIHEYGPGRRMASLHAEVPCDESIMKIHEIIDRAEKEISSRFNVYLVIHMDPINTNSVEVSKTRKELEKIIEEFPMISSIHDFRVVGQAERKKLVFDVVIDYDDVLTPESEQELKGRLNFEIKKLHPLYDAVITFDRDFVNL